MTIEEVSAYLYWSVAWPDNQQLIYMDYPWDRARWTTSEGWSFNDQYFELKHFSYFIQPGFQRYLMTADHPDLRVSAFLGLDGNRLVAVVVNTSASETIQLGIGADGFGAATSAVYRSDFTASVERFSDAGSLDGSNSFTLGPQSVATLVIDKQQVNGSNRNATRNNLVNTRNPAFK